MLAARRRPLAQHRRPVRQVLQRALPGVRGDELYRRVGIAMYSMLNALAGVDLAGYGHPISNEGLDPRFVDQLVVFTSAGLAAEYVEA